MAFIEILIFAVNALACVFAGLAAMLRGVVTQLRGVVAPLPGLAAATHEPVVVRETDIIQTYDKSLELWVEPTKYVDQGIPHLSILWP
ncbi:hypothetical protein TWF506_008352 [Arthrobotrys conoides]|uniref:Uncharacterized protein n=1 Tax=Arthrobotrys conoides TaxID=74498 RepID=A0AAN8NIY1_9PEZI